MSAALARVAAAPTPVPSPVHAASVALNAARCALKDAIQQRDINDAELRGTRDAIAAGNEDRVRASKARALGETVPAAPSHADIEALEIDAQGREAAAEVLAKRVEARKSDITVAEQDLNAAVRSTIAAGPQAKAWADWEAAIDALRDAGVRLMAADRVHRDFGAVVRHFELDGRAAAALAALRESDWPEGMRPNWMPRHGNWRAVELPGVSDAAAQIHADIAVELAA